MSFINWFQKKKVEIPKGKWNLVSETGKVRVYQSDTGTRLETELIHTDQAGNKWYAFKDLFKIPYLRLAYSKQIADLFSAGLTLNDLREWIKKEKDILRGNSAEKYEKLYSLILEKESLIESTADPIKQHLSLCTIYILSEDEKIDYFDMSEIQKKMDIWRLDPLACSFFLNWHINHIANYSSSLNHISEIALKAEQQTES